MDALQTLDDGRRVMETPPDPNTGAASIEFVLCWIRSNGFIASRRTFRIPGNIVKGFTAPIPTADGFSWPPKMTTICPLGPSAPSPIYPSVRRFRDDYLTHIKEGACPYG